MLNRIYIIIGTLAIVVLAGAFLVPRFIQWGDYRGRMEELATSVLGTPVTIRGNIDFSLLPQPRLTFSDVLVGSPEEPAATVDAVEADFSLMEFLRDNYNITKLVLRGPVVDFSVDDSGFFGSGVTVSGASSGVGLGDTTVENATIRLFDRRSGQTFTATDLDGVLRLAEFSGPVGFQGSATYQGLRYVVRFNSAAPDEVGNSAVAASVQEESGKFSVATEGSLTPGMAPKYTGTLTYRQAPEDAAAADEIRGDLVFESRVSGSTDRIVLSGYTLQPDENRAGTRLTGAASIQLGTRQSFDAVISGGVFALPPRDAKEDASTLPFELVRLLQELPAPLIPPLPGRIGVDLAEVGLRGFALRNVRIDARSDGQNWTVEQFLAQLPGDTAIRGNGTLDSENDRPAFRGQFSVASERLDALVALWRKPEEDNVLFNQPARLEGSVMLVGDALGISDGALTLAGATHTAELRIGYGAEQRLDLVAHLGDLEGQGSAVVAAMLPSLAEPGFGVSFPTGSFSLTAIGASLLGQTGRELVAEGHWDPGAISFSRLSAADWGGIGFDAAFSAAGSLAAPVIAGSGRMAIARADAPALGDFYDLVEMPAGWREALALQVPANILVDLTPADETGAQLITADGSLSGADFDLRAELAGGLRGFDSEALRINAALESDDVPALSRQLGLGDAALFNGDALLVTMALQGTPGAPFEAGFAASSGDDSLRYAGSVSSVDWDVAGNGTVDFKLGDAGGLAHLMGATGVSLPPAEGNGLVSFEADRLTRLTEVTGTSAGTAFSGEVAIATTASSTAVTGAVEVDAVSVEGLTAALLGQASLVAGDGVWPQGPIDIGTQTRNTRGTISVTAAQVTAGGATKLDDASFELTWDDTRLRLARFTAAVQTGQLTADFTVCCAGPLADKTIDGRISLTGAPLDAIVPPGIAGALGGVLDGGVQFEATGASIADALTTLSGEGNFTIADFSVEQLAPGVYPTVAALDDLLDMHADALSAIIGLALGQGAFTAPEASGAFTLAGGVARLSNMIVEGDGGRLAGSVNLVVPTLGLDGSFLLTPRNFTDPLGLVGEDTGRILNRIAGTLLAPVTTLDLAEIVAAVQVRANELEVDRLEVLRAEDAARQREAAEQRNRLIEEQRQRAAEEAARLAAEEAARIAAEEEERRLELERQQQTQQQQQPQLTPPATVPNSTVVLPQQQFDGPLDLGLPPVNQPFGQPPNQLLAPID